MPFDLSDSDGDTPYTKPMQLPKRAARPAASDQPQAHMVTVAATRSSDDAAFWHALSSPSAVVTETPDKKRGDTSYSLGMDRLVSRSHQASNENGTDASGNGAIKRRPLDLHLDDDPEVQRCTTPDEPPRVVVVDPVGSPTPIRKKRKLIRRADRGARGSDSPAPGSASPVTGNATSLATSPSASRDASRQASPERSPPRGLSLRVAAAVNSALSVGEESGKGEPPVSAALNADDQADLNSVAGTEESSAQELPTSPLIDPTEVALVEFFNNAAPEDLVEYTQCTPDQATLLVNLRPYSDYAELHGKIQRTKGITPRVLDNYGNITEALQSLDSLLVECERIGDEMRGIMDHWNDPAHAAHRHLLSEQPRLVAAEGRKLKGYQLVGVSWLTLLHKKKLSGILADDMGLGKTAQVIAFLTHLLELGNPGPHLVVCPSSTLDNWMREFRRWVPDRSLAVEAYQGSQSERFALAHELLRRKPTVLVTTYNVATGTKEDRKFLRKMRFNSMVLDEGHMVKSPESQRYKHLMSIDAPFRLLLTGTPLQNNLLELMALLCFVLPSLFDDAADATWRRVFKLKNLDGISHHRLGKVKKIMAPFVLRRKKTQVLSELPPKNVRVELCELDGSQRTNYDELLAMSRAQVDARAKAKADAKAGKPVTVGIKQIRNVLMDLRKAAAHPLLFRRLYDDKKVKMVARSLMKEEPYWDANPQYVYEDLLACSDFEIHALCRKFKHARAHRLANDEWMRSAKVAQLAKLLAAAKERGDRCLVFSQFTMCLDILEHCLQTLGHRYVRLDGATQVSERQSLIDEFQDNEDISVFLLSTKAGGLGLNLTAANVVILHDLDFNPHNDSQAEDRAWRLGQVKAVEVVKLVCKDTIEEMIYRRQEIKLALDQKLTHDVVPGDGARSAKEASFERDVMQMLATQLGAGDDALEDDGTPIPSDAEAGPDDKRSVSETASWGTNSVR